MSSTRVPHVAVLDGFRALAILGVVVLHLCGASGVFETLRGTAAEIALWGVLGNVIDAFFIISGFVLFLPVVIRGGELGSLSRYAIGRAARLVPAYWLSIVVVLVLAALFAPGSNLGQRFAGFPGAGEVLIHLGALQMPARLLDGTLLPGFGINGPLWMISVIAGFYVVFPFVARAYHRHPLIGLAVAAAITFGWKLAALHATGVFETIDRSDLPAWAIPLVVTDQLPGWAYSFALGMTAAWAYVRLHRRPRGSSLERPALVAGVLALVAYGVCAYAYGRSAAEISGAIAGSAARTDPYLALADSTARALVMAAIALGPLWLRQPFANRPIRRLADLSYGIYLIHLVVIVYVGVLLLGLPQTGSLGDLALWSAVVIPVSIGYAYLSRRFVELPARDWARRATVGPPRPEAPGGAAAERARA